MSVSSTSDFALNGNLQFGGGGEKKTFPTLIALPCRMGGHQIKSVLSASEDGDVVSRPVSGDDIGGVGTKGVEVNFHLLAYIFN